MKSTVRKLSIDNEDITDPRPTKIMKTSKRSMKPSIADVILLKPNVQLFKIMLSVLVYQKIKLYSVINPFLLLKFSVP